MNNLEILNNIMRSSNTLEEFHLNYKSNIDFKNWLINILPEIEYCINQQQNNPWHIYNVMDHILKSVEEINKQTKDLDGNTQRILAYTMLYHDIGKPKCHLIRKKDGKIIDSFFNHNIESAKVVNRTIRQFGFNDAETKIIEALVFKHDIFMFITMEKTNNPYHRTLSSKIIDEEISYFDNFGNGKQLLEYLLLVGKADSLAQNPLSNKKSLLLLNEFSLKLKNYYSNSKIK